MADPRSDCPVLIPLDPHKQNPQVPLDRAAIVVGSIPGARVHISSKSVSRAHAILVRDGAEVVVRDLVSRNGTFVNQERVREHALKNGDVVQIGDWQFQLKASAGAEIERAPSGAHIEGEEIPPVEMRGRTMLIGGREGCDVVVKGTDVGPAHAIIFSVEGGHQVRDLGWGTSLNGEQIHQQPINDGDELTISGKTLVFHVEAEALVEEGGELPLELDAEQVEEKVDTPVVDQEREAEAFDDLIKEIGQPGE